MPHRLVFFKDLSAWEKQERIGIINAYQDEHYPLIVPLTLINQYEGKYGQEYLSGQQYLNPHPIELNLYITIYRLTYYRYCKMQRQRLYYII